MITATPSARTEWEYHQIDLALQGDQKAFRLLWNQYHRYLYFRILRMVHHSDDAQDLTVEVFAKAFANLYRFEKHFAFSTWLFRIGFNHTLDFIRRKRIVTMSLTGTFPAEDETNAFLQVSSPAPGPEEHLLQAQRTEQFEKSIKRLPSCCQQVIRLRYYNQLSYAEISRQIQMPLGTVKSYLHRAKRLLRKELEYQLYSF